MSQRILRWAPRVAGLLLTAFFAMFAAGAIHDTHTIVDGVMHLAPTLLMLALVALGWRRPLYAGVALLMLAVLYAATARRPDWALVISGPLIVAGALYVLSWRTLKRP